MDHQGGVGDTHFHGRVTTNGSLSSFGHAYVTRLRYVVDCVVARTISRLSRAIVQRTSQVFATPYFGTSRSRLGGDGERKRCCHQIRVISERGQGKIVGPFAAPPSWYVRTVPVDASRMTLEDDSQPLLDHECVQHIFPVLIKLPCLGAFAYMGSVGVEKVRFIKNMSKRPHACDLV